MDSAITKVQLIAEAVYDQSPGEFFRSAQSVMALQRDLALEIEAAENKLTQARENDDEEAAKAAFDEVKKIRRKLYYGVEERVYRKGLAEKVKLVAMNDAGDSSEASAFLNELAHALTEENSVDPMEGLDKMAASEDGLIDELTSAVMAEKRGQYRRIVAAREKREKEKWKINTVAEKRAYKSFERVRKGMRRASEMSSPAPANHFLRAFGQSDRELVENSSDQASITQALTMLNGPIRNAVTNRYSVLYRDLKGETFRDRLDTVFLTMLSREPSAEELAVFRQAWDANPEAGSLNGIVWTLLNTRQFLFIQ